MGTHDFIRFPPKLRLKYESSHIWLLLGAIDAKIAHIKSIPIPPNNRLHEIYLTKGIHGTTSIEGNTFSESEVGKILRNELIVPPSREYQKQRVDNMVAAFNTISEQVKDDSASPFTIDLINRYHALVLGDLDETRKKRTRVGAFRTESFGVTESRYRAAPPADLQRLMFEFCEYLNEDRSAPGAEYEKYRLPSNIIRAVVAHVYFAWIHPYEDGNGRTARLIEFDLLLRAGVPSIAAHLLASFYNSTRDDYYRHLQESHGEHTDGFYATDGYLEGFIEYALQGFKDELGAQLARIHGMHLEIQLVAMWQGVIHDYFRRLFSSNQSSVQQRRKQIVLEMINLVIDEPITVEEVRSLTPEIELAYEAKSNVTVKRDMNALMDMDLLERKHGGYVLNLQIAWEILQELTSVSKEPVGAQYAAALP